MSANLSTASIPQCPDAVHEPLRHFQALVGRQAEHPQDQGIVLTVPRGDCGLGNLWLRIVRRSRGPELGAGRHGLMVSVGSG
jgi:hypothetical protein